MSNSIENKWRVRFRGTEGSWEGSLVAYWEVSWDPISDDYTSDDISAEELLHEWATKCIKNHKDGLVPIHWFVESKDAGKFEAMPFAYDHSQGKSPLKDFLVCFCWPEHANTGQLLDWLALPVKDKLWNKQQMDKGGFIQEATAGSRVSFNRLSISHL